MAHGRSGRKSKGSLLGWLVVLALVAGVAVLCARTADTLRVYRAEAAVTPTPSITPRPVNITPKPGETTPAPTEALLRSGSIGEDVKQLQQRLAELGFYAGEIDGQFGNGTKAAVARFQAQHGLAADGIVGDDTRGALFSQNAKQAVVTATPEPLPVLTGELPILVNRQNPLPSDFYVPDLVYLKDACPAELVTIKGSEIQGVQAAVDALNSMLRAAHQDGLTVWQVSAGYRSYKYQQQLFDASVQKYMDEGQSRSSAASSTRLTVADPGTSEHHTGLAFDITVPGKFFEDTAQSVWLAQHCWEYGFIIRYTDEKQDITGYLGEPWHIRYVGTQHSLTMRDRGLCLEEYVGAQT